MFKILNGLAPDYLQFAKSYNVRNLEMKLNLPKPIANTNYLKKSFRDSAALQWNSLPNNLRTINQLDLLKTK